MKEEILEGNKLIAQFMGHEYCPFDETVPNLKPGWWKRGSNREKSNKKISSNGFLCRKHDELRYWNEWNWLMPAVLKIEATYHESHGYFGVYISSNSCSIQGTKLSLREPNPHYAYFSQYYSENKIKAVWEAVVGFVRWYNENLNRTK
jgi:hypothetical protein